MHILYGALNAYHDVGPAPLHLRVRGQVTHVLAGDVIGTNNKSSQPDAVDLADCPEVHTVDCNFDGAASTLTYIVMAMLLVYVLLWTFYIGRASSRLRTRSYQM